MTAENMIIILYDKHEMSLMTLMRENIEAENTKRHLREMLQRIKNLCNVIVESGNTTPDVQLALRIKEILG